MKNGLSNLLHLLLQPLLHGKIVTKSDKEISTQNSRLRAQLFVKLTHVSRTGGTASSGCRVIPEWKGALLSLPLTGFVQPVFLPIGRIRNPEKGS